MIRPSSVYVSSAPANGFDEAHHRATSTLADMRQRGIWPTPHAYELWLAHAEGGKTELSQRLSTLISAQTAFTTALMEALHIEFFGSLSDFASDVVQTGEMLATASDELTEEAEALVRRTAHGCEVFADYGLALQRGADHLVRDATRDELLHAVAMLSAETVEALQANRDLEGQLAAAATRLSKLRQSLADQRHAAATDPLTGLYNRRVFDAKIKRALVQLRTQSDAVTSLMMLDVDHFKQFNDCHGHQAGDLVLRLIGRLLKDSIKGRDVAARYGGEEFAVILTGADVKAASIVARQITAALADKKLRLGGGLSAGFACVTASAGIAQARLGETPAAFVARADAALYDAKRSGRNRVCVSA